MEKQISETQIMVGDIVHLETGNQVPADGPFLSGQSLKVNESSLGDPTPNFVEVDCNLNPFLFSRTNVIDGSARMLVTAVGMDTRWGNEKSSTNHNKKTPLQARVHNLETSAKRKVCFTVAFLVLVVSLARLFSGNTKNGDGSIVFIGGKTNVAHNFYYITEIIAVTLVTDLDSFSWVVKICLAHSIKRMMGGKVFIPEFLACETLGSVSTIVTDKAAASMLKGSRQFEECLKAGVNIKMVTEEDISAATTRATECGILQPNQDKNIGAVIAGEEFRNYTPEERREKVDGILVMAQCSPLDKLLMVKCLKQKGHVIAVAGNLTDDVLSEADVRISMRIQGDCLIGKERSDTVTMDDNFDSVMMVLKQGRSILNNTQKHIQFQFTATVLSLLNSFFSITTASWSPNIDKKVVYTLVQLIWVNQIMGSFAAMAFGTEQPGEELMEKPPVDRSQPLVTNIMWRNMAAQVVYQIVILEILDFRGQSIFQVNDEVNDTMRFVVLIFFPVFNMFNARKLDEKNIFTGIRKNRVFIAIVATIIVLEVVMVELLHQFMSFERLDWLQWMVCIGVSFASWPIGLVVKFVPVPDKPFPSFLGLFLTLFKFKPDSQTIPRSN
ncbi:hypothetical protein RJ639_044180 [Escallonia herrerae]|uniref:Calcium-transporting ATPase n=1 Tax=Escallonia herrerae TaxID=1293975 RepID=A0AA88WCC7_9ASTE|nr:hypothetical protein RJ639_044180 [Escallonia herrerae]